ncbi:MAG: NAD(P)-dependent alcohol dehydrogenase [Actinomycetota bacterium]|nr:NAD(P)-dependent alcohol dehydrogenase [Actinomycetota bacterium]
MKAVFLEEPKKISIREIPEPTCSDDKVIIRIKRVGICGSDVHFFNDGRVGDFVMKEPYILGHESSGVIEEVGKNVKNFKVGDRVSIEPGVPCYKCNFCLEGRYNLCKKVVFMDVPGCDGALRELIEYDPNFIYKVSDNVSLTQAALVEPLAVGYFAISKAKILPGDKIFILGSGPIGIAILEMARIAGASEIFISDINEYRLKVAKEHGAKYTLNPGKIDIEKFVSDKTEGLGADVAIEAAGSEETIRQSLRVVKSGGKVVWVSVGKEEITIPFQKIIFNELRVEGINRYANSYKRVIELLENGLVNFESYVSKRIKLENVEEAFKIANDPEAEVMKIVIEID